MSRGRESSGDGRIEGGTDPAAGTAPMPRLPSERPRHRQGYWIVAGTATGLVALAGGSFALFGRQTPERARVAAADCGLVRCSATLPATIAASPAADGTTSPVSKRRRAAATHVTSSASPVAARQAASGQPSNPATPPVPAQAPSAKPTPRPARSPSPPPGPPVTVTFTVDQTENGWGGERFTGHFTVVNHTGAAITGWTLQAGLGSGYVRWVSTSSNGWPEYPNWSQAQDGVVINGPQSYEDLAAHGTTVFYLSGWGGATGLASCSFNGGSC